MIRVGRVRNAVWVALAMMLVGCGSMPSTVSLPYATPPEGELSLVGPHQQRYKSGPGPEAVAVTASGGRVLPLEKSLGGVLEQVRAHRVLWTAESESLSTAVDQQRNAVFGGSMLGAGAILAKSLDVAKAGAGIAGVSSLWGDHFAWKTQAENYRLASDAMSCMQNALLNTSAAAWSKTFDKDDGRPTFTREFYVGLQTSDEARKAAGEGYDKLETMFLRIHDAVQLVRDRLATKQRNVVLATPSANEIATSLRSQYAAQQGAEQTAQGTERAKKDANSTGPSEEEIAAVPRTAAEQVATTDISPKKVPNAGARSLPSDSEVQAARQRIATTRLKERQNALMTATGFSSLNELRARLADLDPQRVAELQLIPEKLDTCAKRIGG